MWIGQRGSMQKGALQRVTGMFGTAPNEKSSWCIQTAWTVLRKERSQSKQVPNLMPTPKSILTSTPTALLLVGLIGVK